MIVTSHTSPNQIALGAAIGVFFSILPTFSIGMFLALLIAWKKKLNLVSTYLGTLVVNPLNSSVIYFINYKLGGYIIGNNQPLELPITFDNIKFIAKQVYLGGALMGIVAALVAFFSFIPQNTTSVFHWWVNMMRWKNSERVVGWWSCPQCVHWGLGASV